MSHRKSFGLDRSFLTRLLLTAVLPAALMVTTSSARAQVVVGANGMDGAPCFTNGCRAGNGADGELVTANGDSVTAIGGAGGAGGPAFVPDSPFAVGDGGNGGNGGSASASGETNATAFGGAGGAFGDFHPNGAAGSPGNGGEADATSGAISSGSNNALSAATATGGAGATAIEIFNTIVFSGSGGHAFATSSAIANGSGNAMSSAAATGGAAGAGLFSYAGNGIANSSATANGSGSATASAIAAVGYAGSPPVPPGAIATSNATTKNGALAQAQSTTVGSAGGPQSTAQTTFGGVSVRSTVELSGGGSTEATAQGGSGQSPDNSGQLNGFAFSTALPNAAYATTLIGAASNVADALLGPGDTIFGTAILEGGGSSTFDFSFRGDLILGVIDGFADITVNGAEVSIGDPGNDTVIDLGFIGPNIDLTISGSGAFAIGGAVPEPSTWAMMLLGFAGLAFAGYRRSARVLGQNARL